MSRPGGGGSGGGRPGASPGLLPNPDSPIEIPATYASSSRHLVTGRATGRQYVPNLNEQWNAQMHRPRDNRELWQYVRNTFGIAIPFHRVCKNHSAPFEAFADAYFARGSMSVWKASRGLGGKSMLLALLAMTEIVTFGASVSLLGGSGEQSKRVHQYMTSEDPNTKGKFWQYWNAPRGLLVREPTATETRLENGGYLKTLMASQTSVRGPHPQRLRLDEADEVDFEIFKAAMGQTMLGANGVKPQTVMSSTHQYPDGTMSKILKLAHERKWKVHEWCYRENLEPYGWLAASEVARKRNEVPKSMWDVEYEMQEPSPEGRVIDTDCVKALFDLQLGRFGGEDNRKIVVIKPGRGTYYHGADWAKTNDWTVHHTMWRNPKGPDIMAAWTRMGRRPWPQMIGALNTRVKRYKGPCVHDATGVGNVCHDYLEIESEGFDFRNTKQRAEMLTDYIAAIERGDMRYPWIDWARHEHLYATWNDLYGSGHLPDSISAGAMAWRAREGGVSGTLDAIAG